MFFSPSHICPNLALSKDSGRKPRRDEKAPSTTNEGVPEHGDADDSQSKRIQEGEGETGRVGEPTKVES